MIRSPLQPRWNITFIYKIQILLQFLFHAFNETLNPKPTTIFFLLFPRSLSISFSISLNMPGQWLTTNLRYFYDFSFMYSTETLNLKRSYSFLICYVSLPHEKQINELSSQYDCLTTY